MFNDMHIYGKLVFVLLTSGVFLEDHDISFLHIYCQGPVLTELVYYVQLLL